MAVKDNREILRRKKLKAESGYEQALRTLYKLILGMMFAGLAWLAYDALTTAKEGYDFHKEKEQELERRMGKEAEQKNAVIVEEPRD